MGKFDDFKREDEPRLEGRHRCVITSVEEGRSKAGNDMIVVTIRPSGCRFTIKDFIVHNDSFNRKMTQFFDSFPEITEGDFNFLSWIGCEGAVNLKEDKDGYLKVSNYIDAVRASSLPPFEGEKPPKQTITSLEDDDADDDLPFEI